MEVDQLLTMRELEATICTSKCNTAPRGDCITNKVLRKLPDDYQQYLFGMIKGMAARDNPLGVKGAENVSPY